ncbi:hypothetical protein [Rickettsiales endosymbiont of Stachyamoeba lipophora]|uniref:hypothetical protein n=1 Tax=Rickettsiales endosymbiont of Stachyamoeba lipophora TaxID=2486578 RepID=UPI000F653331|nr:hypothetical protein [Rickettsiales endosymbiont of Stachyamoeba lipophora]AZL16134.1 hypothetical protein EF513_06270 [Rickettsiales endosymbiont of Stachyamoeba lipophora]
MSSAGSSNQHLEIQLSNILKDIDEAIKKSRLMPNQIDAQFKTTLANVITIKNIENLFKLDDPEYNTQTYTKIKDNIYQAYTNKIEQELQKNRRKDEIIKKLQSAQNGINNNDIASNINKILQIIRNKQAILGQLSQQNNVVINIAKGATVGAKPAPQPEEEVDVITSLKKEAQHAIKQYNKKVLLTKIDPQHFKAQLKQKIKNSDDINFYFNVDIINRATVIDGINAENLLDEFANRVTNFYYEMPQSNTYWHTLLLQHPTLQGTGEDTEETIAQVVSILNKLRDEISLPTRFSTDLYDKQGNTNLYRLEQEFIHFAPEFWIMHRQGIIFFISANLEPKLQTHAYEGDFLTLIAFHHEQGKVAHNDFLLDTLESECDKAKEAIKNNLKKQNKLTEQASQMVDNLLNFENIKHQLERFISLLPFLHKSKVEKILGKQISDQTYEKLKYDGFDNLERLRINAFTEAQDIANIFKIVAPKEIFNATIYTTQALRELSYSALSPEEVLHNFQQKFVLWSQQHNAIVEQERASQAGVPQPGDGNANRPQQEAQQRKAEQKRNETVTEVKNNRPAPILEALRPLQEEKFRAHKAAQQREAAEQKRNEPVVEVENNRPAPILEALRPLQEEKFRAHQEAQQREAEQKRNKPVVEVENNRPAPILEALRPLQEKKFRAHQETQQRKAEQKRNETVTEVKNNRPAPILEAIRPLQEEKFRAHKAAQQREAAEQARPRAQQQEAQPTEAEQKRNELVVAVAIPAQIQQDAIKIGPDKIEAQANLKQIQADKELARDLQQQEAQQREAARKREIRRKVINTTVKILGVILIVTMGLFTAGHLPTLRNIRVLKATSDSIGKAVSYIIPTSGLAALNKGLNQATQTGKGFTSLVNSKLFKSNSRNL